MGLGDGKFVLRDLCIFSGQMVLVVARQSLLSKLISNAEVQTEQMGFRNHCNIQTGLFRQISNRI